MIGKYSVLMSVYYKEKPEYLLVSIKSMLNQTYKPDEIVLVKDGQLSEELNQVINDFIKEEPFLFKVVVLKENLGLAKALDEGLKNCKNELVARMDSDDISLPKRCELQMEVFERDPNLSIVGTMIDEFYDEPSNIVSSRIVPVHHEDIVKFIKRRSPFNHPTVMYKKSAVTSSGGYGELRRKQDLDLFSRMINNDLKAYNINQSLLLFRSNRDNFQRRKSWDNCRSYINVEVAIWKRGHCSLTDLAVVIGAQFVIYLAPLWLLKKISGKYLRSEKKNKENSETYI